MDEGKMLKQKNFRQSSAFVPFLLAALLLPQLTEGDIENTFHRSGAISGQVFETSTGETVPLVEIQLWNERGEYLDTALTDMNGLYSFQSLLPGRYYTATFDSGFADELYSNRPCPYGECDPTVGTPIEVRAGAVTAGVDFWLER